MKSKHTKKALLMSVVSMFVCMAMLAGSTFAWFTDSVTSGKNKIVAGNLDVELYAKNGDTYEAVTNDTNLFMKDALWEPGHVEVVNLKVANVGKLALQYKFGVNVAAEKSGTNQAGETFNLSDYIMFALIDGEQSYESREAAIAAAEANAMKLSALAVDEGGELYPAGTEGKASEKLVTLVVYMPTTVANEANYKTGTEAPFIDLGVSLVATQTPFESDSFDQNYDANATQKNEVAKFTFANASDAAAFCPNCYNVGSTADHETHELYLKVKNGVAEIERTGAWLSFADLNWDENTYAMDYDVDLSALDNNAFVAFDAGEQTTWTDLQIGFKRTEAGITAYNTLFSSQLDAKALGEIGEKVHITYTYASVGSDLKMTATVTDGENTYNVERTVRNFAASTKLCWNVYTVEGDADTYAALDNIVFRSASRFQLGNAVAEGGYVRLPEDTMTLSKVHVEKDTTIDLADNQLMLLPSGNLEINAGNIKIQNGTVAANHSFGYIDIRNVSAPVKLEFENVKFECTEPASSTGSLTNNIISAFIPDEQDVEVSFKNCTFKNAAVDFSSDKIKSVVFENCTFDNIASSSDVTINLQNVPTTEIRFDKCAFKITNVYGVAEPINVSRASGNVTFTGCEFDVNQTVTNNGVCCALNASRLQAGASLVIQNCKFNVVSSANAVCQVIDASYNYDNPVTITDNEAVLTFGGSAYHTFVASSLSTNATVENNVLTGF